MVTTETQQFARVLTDKLADNQHQASGKLQAGDEPCVERRCGYTQLGKEAHNLMDIGQLPPSGLHELPSPVQPYGEQERRL